MVIPVTLLFVFCLSVCLFIFPFVLKIQYNLTKCEKKNNEIE